MKNSVFRSCLAHCLGVFLICLSTISVGRAQAWFTQRTVEGHSTPVINGVRDAFARSVEKGTIGAKGQLLSAVTSTPTVGSIFSATGLPLAIPDYPGPAVTSTINVPAVVGAQGVRVSLFIQHTYSGDLKVVLTAPDGTVFTLSDLQGGSTANISISNQVLTVPTGFNPQGAWALSMQDFAGGDVGQLNSFSLAIPSSNDGAFIDLVVGLQSNPTGDNNGNTQGVVGSEQQDKWERIMQHFADAVFEMTEGRHKMRDIRVFRNGKNFGAADIQWSASGHPCVLGNGGVGVPGGHINMYETFVDGEGAGHDHDMLADEVGSGYTQAHEFGHFFYGVYDEYFLQPGDIDVSPSVMSCQWKARNGDFRWLNFSIKHQSGGDLFQDTLFNRQHRAFGASCWEVLARPVADDPTDQYSRSNQGLGPRIYYPELASAAPSGTNVPVINLPSNDARSALNIIWMVDNLTMEIVIDNSGSMDGTPVEQAKTAAQLLVDQVTLGSARVGVTVFNSTVTSIMPLTDVNTESDRTAIKNAIATITAGGNTAIGDAASSALAKVLAGSTANETRVVFLLSDGQSNTGSDPLSVIPAYATAKIPLFTFAFGASADTATLGQMASGTGGGFYVSPTSLAQISAAFLAANQTAQSTPGLGTGSIQPSASAAATLSVPVDSTLNRLRVTVVYSGSAPASTVTLTGPDGTVYPPTQSTPVGTETLLFFDVSNPTVGAWTLRGDPTAAGTTFSYTISGVHAGIGYDVNTGLQGGGTIVTEPGPVILESKLARLQGIAGAAVDCVVTRPDSTTVTVQFKDDGVFPDLVANDGTYTGTFYHSGQGTYSASVVFSNPALSARETYVGAICSPDINGNQGTVPSDVPVTENFVRSQTLQFTVQTAVTSVAPSFSTNPSDQTVIDGGNTSFAAGAAGAPAPTYRWQCEAAGSATWLNLSDGGNYAGTSTATLTVSIAPLAMSGDQFRCVATNGVAPGATSAIATLTVQAVLPPPTQTTAGAVISSGFTVTWGSVAEATGYRLDVSTDSSFSSFVSGFQDLDIGNATSKTLNGLNANTTYYYRVRAYNGSGTGANSITVTVATCAPIVITTPLIVSTIAGQPLSAGGSDGTGSAARFYYACGIAADSAGNLFIADTDNHAIRKVLASTGAVTTLAGLAGSSGDTDGTGSAARFNNPSGVAVDSSGNVYVADTMNNTLRMVTASGVVSTLAGSPGTAGSADGTGSAALFYGPQGLAIGAGGTLYVADSNNHTIRKFLPSSGIVNTIAGRAGNLGSADGQGSSAQFYFPSGVAVDGSGNLFVADTENHTIRAISPAGLVSTLAGLAGSSGGADGTGSSARFDSPSDVAVDSSGNIYVADSDNFTIREVIPSTRAVNTLAGVAGTSGSADGLGSAVRFFHPVGIAVDSNANLYVADTNNDTVRVGQLAMAPTIQTQPQSQTVTTGGSAQFSVTASGRPAVTYQWYFGSTAINGATSSSYSLSNAQSGNAGNYTVVVSNLMGHVTSNGATLTVNAVNPPPTGGGGSGGGGGAPSEWFCASLLLLAAARVYQRRAKDEGSANPAST